MHHGILVIIVCHACTQYRPIYARMHKLAIYDCPAIAHASYTEYHTSRILLAHPPMYPFVCRYIAIASFYKYKRDRVRVQFPIHKTLFILHVLKLENFHTSSMIKDLQYLPVLYFSTSRHTMFFQYNNVMQKNCVSYMVFNFYG